MARFNRFGAVYSTVVALFPGAALADFDQGGTAGQTNIEAVLDRITRIVASALSPTAYRQMTQVDAQMVERYATAGQTTATLGLLPALTGRTHLWVYPNPEIWTDPSMRRTDSNYGRWGADIWTQKPRLGLYETTGFAVNLTTGAITGIPAMNLGDRVYATYDIDVDNATFTMPSIADIVVLGTAAEVGARLYSEGTSEWKLVDEYRTRYADLLKVVAANEWVPDELRQLRYWQDVERGSDEVKSVRIYRG